MVQQNREAKEIRLFGQKSIREQAYRQKILQLEKEISRLEDLAKEPYLKDESPPSRLEGLYYENLLSFDKRVKKEQEFLERRTAEITERLDLRAQRLILSLESSFRHKLRGLALLIFLSAGLFVLAVLMAPVFYKTIANLHAPDESKAANIGGDTGIYRRLSYIRTAMQTQTIYRNQYEVSYLDMLDGIYVAEIELNFEPTDKWVLKKLSSAVIDIFQRYVSDTAAAEINFLYKDVLYMKARLPAVSHKARLQYFY